MPYGECDNKMFERQLNLMTKQLFLTQFGDYDGYRLWLIHLCNQRFIEAPKELKRRACELHDENAQTELDKFCCQDYSEEDLSIVEQMGRDGEQMKYQKIYFMNYFI